MNKVIDKIELYLLCLTAVSLPLYAEISTIFIALLVFVFFFKKENYSRFYKLFTSKEIYILIFPYLFYWIGMLNTEHIKDGFFQIEIVSSLLIFPFIFYSYKNNSLKNTSRHIFSFFILGIILSYIICLASAIPKYLASKDFDVFFYQDFSSAVKGPQHLSYNILFALIILISSLFDKANLSFDKKKYKALIIVLFVIFSIYLLQLSTKSSIFFYFAMLLFIFIYSLHKKLILYKIAVPIFALILGIAIFAFSSHKVELRFGNFFNSITNYKEIDLKSQESTAMRIAGFKAGISVVKQNIWFGAGSGDVLFDMYDYYKENKMKGAQIHFIGPHNQFIKTFAMHGILGFLSLVSVFVLMFYLAIKNKSFIFLFWTIVMFYFFNFDDMFVVSDSVIFFSFFTSFFIFNYSVINSDLPQLSN